MKSKVALERKEIYKTNSLYKANNQNVTKLESKDMLDLEITFDKNRDKIYGIYWEILGKQ